MGKKVTSMRLKKGVLVVYCQLYPFAGLMNYTSAIIHHVRIDGMETFFVPIVTCIAFVVLLSPSPVRLRSNNR